MKNNKFALERKGNNEIQELAIDLAGLDTAKSKILDGKSEKMILVKNPKTKKMERHSVYTSVTKLQKQEKILNSEGLDTLIVRKEIKPNQYDGIFLIEKPNGDVTFEIGLDGTLKEVNKLYKKEFGLRKQRAHKEILGYVAFGEDKRTNDILSTRMYQTNAEALEYIKKRPYIEPHSINSYRVIKYYKGFEFKHQDLDSCLTLKAAKLKLRK